MTKRVGERGQGKNKAFLMGRLQDMYGKKFHPIMKMAENCDTLQKIADAHREGAITTRRDDNDKNPEMIDATTSAIAANAAWEKIAPYIEPKLSAVDHSGEVDQTLTIIRKEYKPST